MEDRLYGEPELAQFYDLENGWGADLEYCLGLASKATSVLDLGCGTGMFLARAAAARKAVGVDPAAAMLAIARRRPGGDRVTWVEADARTVRLDRRFDLVVLTGHAFQVFLTDDDQRAVLATIVAHLGPGGRFVFDTRNPAAEAWRAWTPAQSQRRFKHPALGPVEAWNDAAYDSETGIVTYQTHYRITASGRRLSASSRIRFTPRAELAGCLRVAGLAIDAWLGDWSGSAYVSGSPEIIPVGRLR
jgi:SAM-dependent methyltransferase